MRDRKIFRRIAAVLMAGAMAATMSMGVMAEENGTGGTESAAPTNVTITKEITKGVNDYAPNTTFEFSITPGTEVSAENGSEKVYAGPAGGATISGTIVSEPKDSDINHETIQVGSTNIVIHNDKFTAPGIYRYVVTEIAGTYEGIDYTSELKYFDVYVNSDKQVYSYAFVSANDPKVKDDGVFTNDYGKTNDSLHDLTISKKVEGNQGDTAKDFTFTIGVTGQNGVSEQYYVTFSDNRAAITLTSGQTMDIVLKNDQSATIYGLSENDTYTVTETDYSSDGYSTTVDGAEGREKSGEISEETTISFVNTKTATTPTGLVMDIAPYLLMVVAAAVLAVVFLRKRRIAE